MKCVLDFLIRPATVTAQGLTHINGGDRRKRPAEESYGESDGPSPTKRVLRRRLDPAATESWRRHTQEWAVEQSVAADGAGASDHAPLLNWVLDDSIVPTEGGEGAPEGRGER